MRLLLEPWEVVEVGNGNGSVKRRKVVQEFAKFDGAGDVAGFAGGLDEEDEFFVDGLFAGEDGVSC